MGRSHLLGTAPADDPAAACEAPALAIGPADCLRPLPAALFTDPDRCRTALAGFSRFTRGLFVGPARGPRMLLKRWAIADQRLCSRLAEITSLSCSRTNSHACRYPASARVPGMSVGSCRSTFHTPELADLPRRAAGAGLAEGAPAVVLADGAA
jgi:hypothetical protein